MSRVIHRWYIDEIDGYISINTQLRAGFSDQFNIGANEGAYHTQRGEFTWNSSSAAFAGLWGGVDLAAGFSIIPGLRLLLTLDLPFWGHKSVVDIDAKFPLDLPEARKNAALNGVLASSSTTVGTAGVSALKTFQQNLIGETAVNNYIEQCYAPANDVAPQPAPTPQAPQPGDPSKLIPDHLWPCNICVFVPPMNDPAHGINTALLS